MAASLFSRSISTSTARRQGRGRRIPTELAELVLDVLVGLRRDIPTSPFPLKFGNELPGCCHSSSIPVLAFGFDPPEVGQCFRVALAISAHRFAMNDFQT